MVEIKHSKYQTAALHMRHSKFSMERIFNKLSKAINRVYEWLLHTEEAPKYKCNSRRNTPTIFCVNTKIWLCVE